MPEPEHFVAELKIEHIVPATNSTQSRSVDEYVRIVVKDASLEGLKQKLSNHIALV